MSKHTRGPWKAGGPVSRENLLAILTGSKYPNGLTAQVWEVGAEEDSCPPGICVVNNYYFGGKRWSAEANARLIAAAPELLAACEALLQMNKDWIECMTGVDKEDWQQAIDLTRAALAKAHGETL